jgi:hypothetical protein
VGRTCVGAGRSPLERAGQDRVVHPVGEGVRLHPRTQLIRADGTLDTAAVGVSALEDEQLIAFEVFAADQLAAARARFAELAGHHPVSG